MGFLALAIVALASRQADMDRFRDLIRMPQIAVRADFQVGDAQRAIAHSRWIELDRKGKTRSGTEDLEWLANGEWPIDATHVPEAKAALAKPGLTESAKLRLLVLADARDKAQKLDAALPRETKEQMVAHAAYWVVVLSDAVRAPSLSEEQRKALPEAPRELGPTAASAQKLIEEIDSKPWAFDESMFTTLRVLLATAAKANAYTLPVGKATALAAGTDDVEAANATELLLWAVISGGGRSPEATAALGKPIDRLAAIVAKLPPEARPICARELLTAYRVLGRDDALTKLLEATIAELPTDHADRCLFVVSYALTLGNDRAEGIVADQRKVADQPLLRQTDARLLFASKRWVPLDDVLDSMTSSDDKAWAETARKALALYRAQTPEAVGTVVQELSELANKQGEPADAVADRIFLMVVGCAMAGQMDSARRGLASLRQWEPDYPGIDALAKAVGDSGTSSSPPEDRP